jgi:hypothetical protein
MKNRVFTLAMSLGLATLSTFAVSQAPTISEQHRSGWEEGSRQEAQGLKDLQKSQKALTRANERVLEAQKKRDNSRVNSDRASAEFQRLVRSMPQFTDPSIAESWAREVNTAAADWAKFEGRNQESKTELDNALRGS